MAVREYGRLQRHGAPKSQDGGGVLILPLVQARDPESRQRCVDGFQPCTVPQQTWTGCSGMPISFFDFFAEDQR